MNYNRNFFFTKGNIGNFRESYTVILARDPDLYRLVQTAENSATKYESLSFLFRKVHKEKEIETDCTYNGPIQAKQSQSHKLCENHSFTNNIYIFLSWCELLLVEDKKYKK